MLRKAILISASLVAMAAAAHAARWGVSVSVAPNKKADGTIVAPSVSFNPAALSGSLVGGRGFYTFSSSQQSVDFTVDPIDGYKVTNVKVGAEKKFFVPAGTAPTDATYNVNDPKTVTITKPATLATRPNATRVVVATALVAPLRYNVVTNSVPGVFKMGAGYKNVVYGTSGKKVRITPARGYKITAINVTGTSYTAVAKGGAALTGGAGGSEVPVAAPKGEYVELTLGAITGHVNITATAEFQYWANAVVTAGVRGSSNMTQKLSYFADPDKAVILSASQSSSSTPAATYTWSVAPAGATVVTKPAEANGAAATTTGIKTAYFRATAVGTYTVTLTIADGGVTDTATYTIVVENPATTAGCISCHTAKVDPLFGGAINSSVRASAHYLPMSSAELPHANVCAKCHGNHDASFATLTDQPYLVCSTCHVGGAAGDQQSKFAASQHQLGAHSGNYFGTKKCAACHNPHSANVPTSALCTTCHHAPYFPPSADPANLKTAHANSTGQCTKCHDAHSLLATHAAAADLPACGTCHTPEGTGYVASAHNTSATGNTVPDMISHGTNCTQTCHFQNVVAPACASCHTNALQANGSFAAPTAEVKFPTSEATCMVCHEGGRHGVPTYNWEISTHNIANQPAYIQHEAACADCHNPHDLTAAFTVASSGSIKAAEGCQQCHTLGASYGIYSSNKVLKAPHGGGVASSGLYTDGTQKTQFVGNGITCSDCHGHNNTINAGYAEGGHGAVSDKGLNAFAHYDWAARTNNGTRQQGNCDRCHTTSGFLLMLGDTVNGNRTKPVAGQPSNPLACITCHNAPVYDATLPAPYGWAGVAGNLLPEGKLRINETPAGNGKPLSQGYFALFSSSATAITAGNTKIQVEFPGYKNSSVCIPCHSGRATNTQFIETYRKSAAANKNYSTLQNSIYQHAFNMGQSFIGKGAFDYTGNAALVGASAHAAVQMADGQNQGPCVGCHYSTTAITHSLEVNAASATCVACHSVEPNLEAAKANFDAGVKALDVLIRAKMAPYLASGSDDLAGERAGYWRYGRFGKAAGEAADVDTAIKAYGAWYNWQMLSLWDNAAWAHNPAYARVVLMDTIDYLDDATINNSAAATIATINTVVGSAALTGTEITDATQFGQGSELGCVGCHAIDQAGKVDNNGGVRAVMGEFDKRSHHITGGTITNAQCAVCHLEGTAGGGVNATYHMKDGRVHLRNGGGIASYTETEFVWNPASPDHTAMDKFCFSCHNANGAPAAVGIVAGNTAGNPFGDTLTNSYDLVARAGVVDVYTAFNTANASHHAVLGQKYSYRFSNRTNADAWALRNGKTAPADSELADGKTVGGTTVDFAGHYDPAGEHEGGEATLYEADKFVATYIPLGATKNVGDDSTLHCGDCHTVGQWNAGTSTNADGSTTPVAIGAHGSANDYMLRNSLGTDALHSGQTYVCFNCHKGGQLEPFATHGQVVALDDETWADFIAEGLFASTRPKPTWNAGWNRVHPNVIAATVSGYANAHAVSAFHAQCQADSSNQTGNSNTAKSRVFYNLNGTKDRTLDYMPAPNATAALPTAGGEGGNITGIACTNCHNSGLRQGWGGIHGGDVTYTDGLGRTQKSYRFMPGMGNYRYAPPGGWDGKTETDSRLIVQAQPEGSDPNLPANKLAGKPMGGCYTNKTATENVGWSSCAHHGTSTVPVYGGGTTRTENTSTSPTWEPTVREATAGNSLVTRPLKY